jgi:hypothetical protein
VGLKKELNALRRLAEQLESAPPEKRAAIRAELVDLKRRVDAMVEVERRRPRLNDEQEEARAVFAEEYELDEDQLLPPTGKTVQSSPRFKPETMELIEAWGKALGLGSKTNTQRVLVLAMLLKLGPPPGHEDEWDPSTLA